MSSASHIARVIIQLKTRSLDRPFDYRIPTGLVDEIGVGSIVLAPFGHRKVLGIVAAISSESEIPEKGLVEIESAIDHPPVPADLISLAEWLAGYYYCPLASALGLVLPPGGLPQLERMVGEKGIDYRLERPAVRPRRVLYARLASASGVEADEGSDAGGRGNQAGPSDEKVLAAGGASSAGDGDGHTQAQERVLGLLADGREMPVAELCESAGVSRSPVATLARKGELELFEGVIERHALRYYGEDRVEEGEAAGAGGSGLVLNREQERALSAVVSRLDEPAAGARSRPLLLMGVAGAGKTEIYLRAIAETLARGRSAIVLVPEISLTYQAVKRFRRRFGDRVGILHSGLSPGERYDEHQRIRRGNADVVIGPRSALFAPVPDLGLIIIDEENDSSFKQESEPRYDARRVAMERARLEGAALVYGSATPSLESYYRIDERHFLPERATGASMPEVEIVDMRRENDPIFSRRLVEALDGNISSGGKAILLLNRRGYARYLQCGRCGHVWQCGNCDVSLTIHVREKSLVCHHCGYSEQMPDVCPACASTELHRWGVGTERLEREVSVRFPEASVFRLDADSAGGYGGGPRILERFNRAEKAILLGTQMVAKGHHFPEVTLAAVINADLSLQFPEFRAEEQTFAILQQLSGRSGRAERPGRVLIQTWNPEMECIRMAAGQRLEEFYQAELDRRRRLGYPPFRQLINIICQSRVAAKAAKAAGFLKQKLEPVTRSEQILGPADLFRLQGWNRSHILIKTDDPEETLSAFAPVLEHYRGPYRRRGVRLVVDVDPQWLS